MKRLLRDGIDVHLAMHDMIRNSQHGLISGRSCLNYSPWLSGGAHQVDRLCNIFLHCLPGICQNIWQGAHMVVCWVQHYQCHRHYCWCNWFQSCKVFWWAMVTESEEDRRIIQHGLLVDERVSRLADGIDTVNPSWWIQLRKVLLQQKTLLKVILGESYTT